MKKNRKTKATQQHKQSKPSLNRQQPELPRTPARLTGIWTKGRKAILGVLSFLGLLATLSGVLSFFPKVSVTALSPLNATDPFSVPFIISNDGMLTIHSVTFRCRIRHVTDESGAKLVAYDKGGRPINFLISKIEPDEKTTTTIPFPFKFQNPIIGGDFDFVVMYRPDWLLWRQEKSFRFGLTKDTNGQWLWLPRAVSE